MSGGLDCPGDRTQTQDPAIVAFGIGVSTKCRIPRIHNRLKHLSRDTSNPFELLKLVTEVVARRVLKQTTEPVPQFKQPH